MVDFDAVDSAVVATFAEAMTYTPDGGSPVSVSAMYQAPDVFPDSADTLSFETQGPRVVGIDTDFASLDHAATMTVRGVDYRVRHVERDESSVIVVHLTET